MGKFKEFYKDYKKTKKSSARIYVILRLLVVLCMIIQLMRGAYENAFMCILSLILFSVPIIFQHTLKIEFPNVLEIFIFFFIFFSLILGEIFYFYGSIRHWDTLLHTINGFLCAGVGYALVDLFNENSKKINLSPLYVSIVAFCFSMTVGVCWEFLEYGVDKVFLKDMQKGEVVNRLSTVELGSSKNHSPVILKNIGKTIIYDTKGVELATIENGYLDIGLNDTMKDLMVNFVGAVTFSVLGYFYLTNRGKYWFAGNFIPKRPDKKRKIKGDI